MSHSPPSTTPTQESVVPTPTVGSPRVMLVPIPTVGSPHVMPCVLQQLQDLELSFQMCTSREGSSSAPMHVQNLDTSLSRGSSGEELEQQPVTADSSIQPMTNVNPQPNDGSIPQYNIAQPPVQAQPESLNHRDTDLAELEPGEFTLQEEWAQVLFQEIPLLILILSSEMKIKYACGADMEYIGYKKEELVGKVITDFLHPSDSAMYVQPTQS